MPTGSQGLFWSRNGLCQGGRRERAGSRGPCGWSYLAVHYGLLLFQFNLLLPCLSTQESLKDRPFWEAALLLQGRLTVWRQGHREVKWGSCPWKTSQTAQVGEPHSLQEGRGSPTLNQPQTQRLNHMYWEGPQRRHSETLGSSQTHLGRNMPNPCISPETWRTPQPDPHLHLDEYGEIHTVKQDTHGHTQGRHRRII